VSRVDATLGSVRRALEAVRGGTGRVTVTTLDAHLSRTALAPEPLVVMAAVVLASVIPASRALTADPATILRKQLTRRSHVGVAAGLQAGRATG
jgi:ABC-type lipoprotein release transport system permease subunit